MAALKVGTGEQTSDLPLERGIRFFQEYRVHRNGMERKGWTKPSGKDCGAGCVMGTLIALCR